MLDKVDAAFDVGVGSGYWVRVWHDLGVPRVDGCDLVPDAVARVAATFGARGDSDRDRGRQSDRERRPATCQYGFASVMNVLLHVTEDDSFRQALANVARLRPGGHLLLVEPVLLDPTYERQARPEQHSRARRLGTLILILDRAAPSRRRRAVEQDSPAASTLNAGGEPTYGLPGIVAQRTSQCRSGEVSATAVGYQNADYATHGFR